MNGYEKAKAIAETFQAVCVGIAALLGGIGALKILSEWSEKRKAKRQRRKWRKRFPKDKLNEDFRLLRLSYTKDTKGSVIGSSDHVYLCDNRSKRKYWIVNDFTLKELSFNQEEVRGVNQAELNKFADDEAIDLEGLQPFSWCEAVH